MLPERNLIKRWGNRIQANTDLQTQLYCIELKFQRIIKWPDVENHFLCTITLFCCSGYQKNQSVSSVAQSCPTLCNPMNRSTPLLPVHHQLPEFIQIHVHWVSDAIQPSHPVSSASPPAPNLSQHQGLFQWVSSSHQVAKALEFQLQHQSFQWTPRTDLL